jgi:hypothetical protein
MVRTEGLEPALNTLKGCGFTIKLRPPKKDYTINIISLSTSISLVIQIHRNKVERRQLTHQLLF